MIPAVAGALGILLNTNHLSASYFLHSRHALRFPFVRSASLPPHTLQLTLSLSFYTPLFLLLLFFFCRDVKLFFATGNDLLGLLQFFLKLTPLLKQLKLYFFHFIIFQGVKFIFILFIFYLNVNVVTTLFYITTSPEIYAGATAKYKVMHPLVANWHNVTTVAHYIRQT